MFTCRLEPLAPLRMRAKREIQTGLRGFKNTKSNSASFNKPYRLFWRPVTLGHLVCARVIAMLKKYLDFPGRGKPEERPNNFLWLAISGEEINSLVT